MQFSAFLHMSFLCVLYVLIDILERSDEINQCYDEYYPIHQSTLHDIKFLGMLKTLKFLGMLKALIQYYLLTGLMGTSSFLVDIFLADVTYKKHYLIIK